MVLNEQANPYFLTIGHPLSLFAFYGDKNKEALAMASIGWKKKKLKLCRLFLYSIVLLAGGGTKFDVEAASAAATITDTVLGRNSSDTLLGDGSGVISGRGRSLRET